MKINKQIKYLIGVILIVKLLTFAEVVFSLILMWLKYAIRYDGTVYGLKYHVTRQEGIIGGPLVKTDVLYELIHTFFSGYGTIEQLRPTRNRIKLKFDLPAEEFFSKLIKMKEDVFVQKLKHLRRIFR